MNETYPGISRAAVDAAAVIARSLEGPVNVVMDAFYGLDTRDSVRVPRGTVTFTERDPGTSRRTKIMHPLDSIAAKYAGDPVGETEAATSWIARKAHAELDAVSAAAGARVNELNLNQRERMHAWMDANGVTGEHLTAAKALRAHREVTGEAPPFTLEELAGALRWRP